MPARVPTLFPGLPAQRAESYAKLNPSMVVPTLVIDGLTLGQSVSILEYLDETRPERSLLPADPAHRQQVRQIVGIIACDIQPVQNLRVLKKLPEADREAWARDVIASNFVGAQARGVNARTPERRRGQRACQLGRSHPHAGLETLLSRTAGKYCVGDAVTQADACLVPQVYNARRFVIRPPPIGSAGAHSLHPLSLRIPQVQGRHGALPDHHPHRCDARRAARVQGRARPRAAGHAPRAARSAVTSVFVLS